MNYPIEAEKITHRFKRSKGIGWRQQFKSWLRPRWTKVIDNVSLKVKKGEIFALLGPNGAGKTTLIKILTGIIEASEGKARLFGEPMPQRRDKISHRFNAVLLSNLYYYLSGWDNLLFFARIYDLQKPEQKIKKLVKFVEMKNKIHRPNFQYSSGERARINLAKGLLNDPEVLFVDELTLGLDANFTRKIIDHLKNLNKEGMTIFLTTHRIEIAEKLADRTAIIHQGKIIRRGNPDKLKKELKEKNVVLIRLRNPSKKIAKEIRKEEFVESIRMEKGRIRAVLDSYDCSDELIDIIRSAGGRILEIKTKIPTLEDVFTSLTGKRLEKEEIQTLEDVYSLTRKRLEKEER